MKRVLLFIFVLLFGSIVSLQIINPRFLAVEDYFYWSPCDAPIPYRIGTIDERFGLSLVEVNAATEQASDIWNTALGKQLFIHDTAATLTVNMVYDRRQSLHTQINQLENDLNTGKTTLKAEIEKFEKLSGDFDRRKATFKESVDYWNSQGGAPQEEYDKLTQEQQSLKDEAERLNAMAQQLNISTGQYNSQVGQLNQTIRSFKNALTVRPEEGIYNPQEEQIDIFFNNNHNELVRTIAHELGHARGLKHSANLAAIMYPSTTNSLTPTGDEISALRQICRKRPFYEPLFENSL